MKIILFSLAFLMVLTFIIQRSICESELRRKSINLKSPSSIFSMGIFNISQSQPQPQPQSQPQPQPQP